MTAPNNGGPAFPITAEQHPNGISPEMGMSLRDYFAAKALPVLMDLCRKDSDKGKSYVDYVAGLSYKMADAMLKAREEQLP